ncbi:multidrug efflux system protein MdtE [Citrobacter koseri]|uniref:Multidrug efflux system protein MdtE n=1 Tax=Citrobacter koseri TaxID=545 RepID=A0A447UHQ1_CITKO|nr:multidrug efflux system protein MdtE [Citrobacter koseri]
MTELPDSTRWQLWIVAFGFFMQSLDTTIVNTALPSMALSLGESPLHMHMVVVSYVLTVAVMLPASGWLADKVGVRNIFFTAIVLFTLGSLFCAWSSTLNELVLARVLQGVGGAMMVPVGRLTVMKIVPREQYMAAMTFVTLPGQVGPLLGPALGGILVEYASWHWIFLINIPVGIVGAIATLMLMPNYTMQTRRFDLSGFLLLAVGMAVLTMALDGSKGTGLSPLSLGALVLCGILAIALYLKHAKNNPRALFSLALFRTHTFSLGLSGSFAGRVGSGMLPFMTPVFLQIGLGFSPFHAGLMMIPDGTRQHGNETYRRTGGKPLWLSSRTGRHHPRPVAGQPAVYERRDAWLVLRPALCAVPARHGQLHPFFIHEHLNAQRVCPMNSPAAVTACCP